MEQQLTRSEKISLGTKEIAKLVRNQLKKEFPGCKFSVTTEYYSGGSSINLNLMKADIQVIRSPEDLTLDDTFHLGYGYDLETVKERQKDKHHQLNKYTLREEHQTDRWCNGVFLTEEGHKLMQRAVKIVDEYNYDDSDPMTDYFSVNFYDHYSLGKWDKPLEEAKNGR